MNSNHKKRWTKREKQQLLEHAKQAKINKLSPVEFCHKSAPDFGREPEGLFLQLSNLGLLSSEVKWSSLFPTLWQLGHYETISWLGLKDVELMAFNDSHLKLVPFKYPQEDKEELSKLFRQALDKSSPQSWLGVENGPTGLGKTHYMTYEIIKAINDHLSDKKRPKLSIILVAPQHRHLDEIKTNLEKCFQFENRLNVIKAGSVIDMLQSQQEYLPADCPYNNDDDKRNNPAKAILKQMESFLPKKEHHQSQPIGYSIGLLISDLRNKLRKQCKKFIETTLFEQHLEPLMCQQCRFMHIGKVMFNETNKCRVSITFSTYDKLFYGFDTYRINRKKQCYVREFFSPWVSEKTGNLKPIKNAVIFMEESTAGFNILWKKIQESQLKINLTELVSYLYNNFRSHSSKTLSAIHHDNSESTKTFFKKQQQEIKKTLAIMEKLYIQVNDNKIPIFGNNQSIQFKCQDKKNIHQILQSTELFFSDLFSERTIAYQAKQQIELNTIVANIWIADRKQNFLDSGTHSVFPLAFYYLKLGV
ncbi:MAG: hypothetical protein SVR94_01485, partial [Pseudomonadota bacterium]|nr:hypothetical protein [Pseudomonadota bacterium]